MKKIILLLFLLCFTSKVYGIYFYYGDELVPNMYMVRNSGYDAESSAVYVVKRVDTKEFAYCIEPLTNLKADSNYLEYNYNNPTFNLSDEVLKKINLIAYYGYKYPNHEDLKWYGVTQYLIWKTIYPTYAFFFADARFGNPVVWYDNEVNELNYLVEKDLQGFSFKSNYSLKTGKEYILEDNDLLNSFILESSSDLDAKIVNNKLIVKTNKEGNYKIKLKRRNWRVNTYFLYDSYDAQDLFINGRLDDEYVINLEFKHSNLIIYKNDKDELNYTNLSLDGTIYNLYDNKDNLIDSKEVKNGKIIFNIPMGTYYLKEKKTSYGFKLDDNKYKIDVNDDMEYQVYNEKIYKHIIIHKQMNDKLNLKEEENAIFKLYYDDRLIDSYTTNDKGIIDLYLPYGKYKLIQTKGADGYTYADDLEIDVLNDLEETIELINYKEEVLGENIVLEKYEVPDTHQDKKNNYYPLLLSIIFFRYAFIKNRI